MDVFIDVSQAVLKTERLLLRAWREGDLEDFFAYASVEGVGEAAGWPHHETKETTGKILHGFISEKNVFAVVYRENGRVIGSLGLHRSWANDDARYKDLRTKEIGYVLSKAYWGKGMMPEAMRAAMEFCFDRCGIEALTCGHFEANRRSRRVIEKCGFSFAKTGAYYSKQLLKSFAVRNYILLRQKGAPGKAHEQK